MQISRVVVRNFRSFDAVDIPISVGTTCVIGENNTGKTNFLQAIRICLDANLSSSYRSLIPSDIHSAVDISHPSQVLVGIQFTGFEGKTNEEALVGAWQCPGQGFARLIYRFRPRLSVWEDLEAEERQPGDLTIEYYHWEITGGGDPERDLMDIDWDEDIGSAIRFGDLQSFFVVFLPALCDVESDLKQFRGSPLTRLIEAMEIDTEEQEELVNHLKEANDKIAEAESIAEVAETIDASLKAITGPAFSMDVGIGVAEPSFQSIVRALRVLLTNVAMEEFDPRSNGLGLNNMLYVSILIEYFQKRLAQEKTAGQIILFEEPEAHLHPQLQITLFKALSALPFQSILTTHSTHITSHASLASYVVFAQVGSPAIASAVPATDAGLEEGEVRDLERYLDATKSSLLYARKVMLVEGPAELFLIPPLLKAVEDIDLDREGITVVPIYGVHFDAYAKLFSADALQKKCAIVADGDLQPGDATPGLEGEDDLPVAPDLDEVENDYVSVFKCQRTFERTLVHEDNLEMLARAADDVGAPIIAQRLRDGAVALLVDEFEGDEKTELLHTLRSSVLNTAKRFGKARFAQTVARHASEAGRVPKYIRDAVAWLREE